MSNACSPVHDSRLILITCAPLHESLSIMMFELINSVFELRNSDCEFRNSICELKNSIFKAFENWVLGIWAMW